MTTVAFTKGHGTQNDFVLVPDLDGSRPLSAADVRFLTDRHAGIGGDGVIRVVPTVHADEPAVRDQAGEATWFMDYRNADGSPAEMCGNGSRVFARHLYDEGLAPAGDPVRIATRDGVKTLTRAGDLMTVDLGVASVLGQTTVSVDDRTWPATHVVMCNPHAVVVVDDLAEAGRLHQEPAYDEGVYPDGVNIEFVVRRGPDRIAMRVHERGAGETRSCGTGACAAAVAVAPDGAGRWRVDVPGGTLEVSRNGAGAVHLTGPAVIVARGESDL
jgi:diaminopimelate epimerase